MHGEQEDRVSPPGQAGLALPHFETLARFEIGKELAHLPPAQVGIVPGQVEEFVQVGKALAIVGVGRLQRPVVGGVDRLAQNAGQPEEMAAGSKILHHATGCGEPGAVGAKFRRLRVSLGESAQQSTLNSQAVETGVAHGEKGRTQDPRKGEAVSRVMHHGQEQQQVDHLFTAVKPPTGQRTVWQARLAQSFLVMREVGRRPEEHGDIARLDPPQAAAIPIDNTFFPFQERGDPSRDQRPFRLPVQEIPGGLDNLRSCCRQWIVAARQERLIIHLCLEELGADMIDQ